MQRLFRALLFCFCATVCAADGQNRTNELIRANQGSVALVKGAEGGGSAFIAKIGQGKYLITNQHVVADIATPTFTLADRTVLKTGSAAAALEHDIMSFGIDPSLPAIEAMQQVDQHASIGDEVLVLGNPSASGVIRPISGKILGIGPQLVEVSAEFIAGNSGSPIIHVPTGKVIGVATYIEQRKADFRQGRLRPTIRRFGYRLDSIKRWEPVRWWHYYDEQQTIENVQRRTMNLNALLNSVGQGRGMPTHLLSDRAVQEPFQKFLSAARTIASQNDATKVIETFMQDLQRAATEDIDHARQRIGYSYFIERLAEEERNRAPIAKELEQILKSRPGL